VQKVKSKALVAIVISVLAAAWFASGVNWSELGTVLTSVDPLWVAVAAALLLGEFAIRAVRWKVLLRPLGTTAKVSDLFAAQVIGAATNTLFPLRAGEIAKPVVAAKRTGYSLTSVVATAVMERVYDLFGLLSVLLIMVLVLPDDGARDGELVSNLKIYGAMFGGFAMICMFIFFILATREKAARATFEAILKIAPPPVRNQFMHLFDGFVKGLGNAKEKKGLLQAGALSVWMWFNGALAIYCLFMAMGMALPFGAACFVAVAIALTVALPQAPGFIGVFHVAMEKTMLLWGQADANAQGFAIVFWAVSFLPVTIVGVVAIWREGLDWASLRGDAEGPLPAPNSTT